MNAVNDSNICAAFSSQAKPQEEATVAKSTLATNSFIKLYQHGKLLIWESRQTTADSNANMNQALLLLNFLLQQQDVHSLNLLGLSMLADGSFKKSLKFFMKSLQKNNKQNPMAFLAMSLISTILALSVKK